MYVSLTPEHAALRSSIRRFFDTESPIEAARGFVESDKNYEPRVWARMARELGLQGLLVPERYDGADATFVEMAITLEEMGRQLVCSPFFSSAVLATEALLTSGDSAAMSRYLSDIAAGTTIATLAVDLSRDLSDLTVAATMTDTGYELNGHIRFVVDIMSSDLMLVPANTATGISLFAVSVAGAGLIRSPHTVLDGTRPMGSVDLDRTPGELVGSEGHAAIALRTTLDAAAIALAAEQLGGAQACLDMAVGYAKSRAAFGRPIGSFQAIKHKCADMFLAIEAARNTVYHAARTLAEGEGASIPFQAAACRKVASDAFLLAASQNIQIHGGIGFTWEHDAHLYLKRARATRELLGSPAHHLARVADQMI
ncbi:acyl-CoA dehydrogenase family protein [Rhodococcus opacus]|uniref:acyl-CoA dehydrogenase family protein n=1 Tax=Rhodococcus opacus TaxID=37919 RepID=UPI001BB0B418|nr:acyl-CoA dehydrogenase family protein [Rhodococcus opacus]WKN60265.1 acyl-CoA dehydrogenase family protein [Rhodococcus opacus]